MNSSRQGTESTKKKYSWTGLELRGPIKNLSPVLWSFTHLTSLYLNDNNLQRLPPDIVNLSNLSLLDLSGNKLRSLPSELGDMIQLRELLLNNNSLRILPCELGRLFLLQVLDVAGNPLSVDILNMAAEPQGTSKLLAFLIDNLTGENDNIVHFHPLHMYIYNYASHEVMDQFCFCLVNLNYSSLFDF